MSRFPFIFKATACILAAAVLAPAATSAQTQKIEESPPSKTDPASTEINAETIVARKKSAEDSTDLDEETKKKAADLYRQAEEDLINAAQFSSRSVEFASRADNADEAAGNLKHELEDIKSQLAAAKQRLETVQLQLRDPDFVPESAPGELEKTRVADEQELKKLKDALVVIEAESTNRANRRKEIRSRLAEIDTLLADVSKQLSAAATAGENPLLTLAKQTERLARKESIARERPALERELAAYDAEDAVDKLRLARDLKTQQTALATLNLQISELQFKRKSDRIAQDAVFTAQQEANSVSSPANMSLAERNLELARKNRTVTIDTASIEARRKELQLQLDDLKRQFELTRKKVDSVGLPASVGAMLRKQRTMLPDVRSRRAAVEQRQPIIDAAQLELFDLDDERAQLADLDSATRQHVQDELSAAERDTVAQEAKVLLERKMGYLDPLIRSQNAYFDALAELSITEQQLAQRSQEFADYIDERVLWIRSGQPLTNELDIRQSSSWLFRTDHWIRVGRGLVDDAQAQPYWYLLFLALFFGIIRFAARMRRQIHEIGDLVQRSTFSQFMPTVHAALLTMLIAMVWPGLVAFISWRLDEIARGDEFIGALATGTYFVASVYLFLELLRQLCRPRGLAEAHFGYPESSVKLLRRSIRFLMLFGLPLVFVVATLRTSDPGHGRNSLERMLFIVGSILLSFIIARIVHPTRGVFHYHLALHPEGWSSRLSHVWYSVAIASPLLLGCLTFLGYHYTAQQLAWRVYVSFAFGANLSVLYAFVRRLLMVHRRRLSIEQARQRRAAIAAAEAEAGPDAASSVSDIPVEDETFVNLSLQTQQTRRLVATVLVGVGIVGIWAIWVDVFPALGFLERWPLWQSTTQITEVITNDAGEMQTRVRDVPNPITFADLIFAVLIAAVTLIAAQNLPGLLEISVLQRLPLEASIRYASTTLCSYAILLAGLIAACNTVGLRWSQIQWMATALTFGLAFGLQEMFANFVAGIIILFERPIRVGDIVTLGDISGVVSRVRIRATTITNWDRKDFVVPNKDFITGRVLNWTLSDQVSRIVVNVGVAYGSDTAKAKELLLRIARDHPQIVDEPQPMATFEEFGESSLTLVLRCFIAMRDMPSRLQIIDDVHSSIDDEFKKAKIEIAFPQRDLHVRSFLPTVGLEPRNGVVSDGLRIGQ